MPLFTSPPKKSDRCQVFDVPDPKKKRKKCQHFHEHLQRKISDALCAHTLSAFPHMPAAYGLKALDVPPERQKLAGKRWHKAFVCAVYSAL